MPSTTDMTGAQLSTECGQAGDATGPLRLMAVHAHPDDESSKGGATMARYVREGAEVLVCTLTGGERGDILNKAMDRPEIALTCPGSGPGRWSGRAASGACSSGSSASPTPGLPEGDPLPPLPEGSFALVPAGGRGGRAAGPRGRAFRPHVYAPHLRRAGRLPASGPHPVPQRQRRGVRGRRGPRPVSRLGRAVAAAEAVLLRQLPPRAVPGAARGTAAARDRVAVRRLVQVLG